MIERNGWHHDLICDHCVGENTGGKVESFDEFDEAVKYKKTHGWKSLKSDRGTWYEFCPKCAKPEIMQEYRSK